MEGTSKENHFPLKECLGVYLSFSLFFEHIFIFILVPSLSPSNLRAHNTSSTTLRVTWLPVPQEFLHGILLGYRLFFKAEKNLFYENVTTVNQTLELTGLEKFTNYSMKILAFTRIGDGNVSHSVTVSTDQDGS